MTDSNSTFFVAFTFTFIKRKQEADNVWLLEQLRAATNGHWNVKVIITDRDLALMNAVARVFSNAKHLLCEWHINKNVKVRCWPFFCDLPATPATTPEQHWTRFEKDRQSVIRSLSVPEFNRWWKAMMTRQRLPCSQSFSVPRIGPVWNAA
jgi:hypothetical protein